VEERGLLPTVKGASLLHSILKLVNLVPWMKEMSQLKPQFFYAGSMLRKAATLVERVVL
jgi:hypothetical protein